MFNFTLGVITTLVGMYFINYATIRYSRGEMQKWLDEALM